MPAKPSPGIQLQLLMGEAQFYRRVLHTSGLVVIVHRCFGTICRFSFQGSKIHAHL